MSGPLVLRPATHADVPLLRRWDEAPHVIASDPDSDWNWDNELGVAQPWREQLVAEADRLPIGFVQIIDPALEDSHYWGAVEPDLRAIDIWIGEASHLGRGWGTRIMTLALARCFAPAAVRAVLIDPLASNLRAHRFYQRLGFRPVERRRFGTDDCLVHRLERAQWQARVRRPAAR